MLLPAQIQGHQFQMSRGTYKSTEVDAFIQEVYTSYDQMFRENGDLIKKLEVLAAKVEEYRKDEDNIRIALLTAQRMADQITREAKDAAQAAVTKAREDAERLESQAQAKATRLLAEAEQTASATMEKANSVAETTLAQAKMESERILGGVKKEVVTEQAILDRMKKEVSEFRSRLMSMYKDHIERINDMPTWVAAQYSQEAVAAAAEESEPSQEEEPQPEAPVVQEDGQDSPQVQSAAEMTEPEPVALERELEEPIAEEQAEQDAPPQTSLQDMVNAVYAEVEQEKAPQPAPEYQPKTGGFQVRIDHLEEEAGAGADTHVLPKFKDLKFGDNYDISADADDEDAYDDEKPRKGFFRKK